MSIFERYIKKGATNNVERRRDIAVATLESKLESYAVEDKRTYPEDAGNIDLFLAVLRKELQKLTSTPETGEGNSSQGKRIIDSELKYYISPDRMSAYICIFPPIGGGAEPGLGSCLEELKYEGIMRGIDTKLLENIIQHRNYLHIFPIARGKEAVDGKDGEVLEFFERKAVLHLEVKDGETVDFNRSGLIQVIRKGEVICQIKPPEKAQDGYDVTGKTLRGKVGASAKVVPGKNTRLSQDGQLLMAGIDGVVSIEDKKFCVERQRIIIGDANQDTGNINYPGAVFIRGNVEGGITISATGNIVIEGEVRDARIISEGTIRVQKGICGEKIGYLKAAKQIQCYKIEDAVAIAGENIISEMIISSDITSGGSVYVTGERGMVLGGYVKVRNSLIAKRIGNITNRLNLITLGYFPELRKQLDEQEAELEKTRRTLEKIRKNVLTLKSLHGQLSAEKRQILEQLTEQKRLYSKKETELEAWIQKLKQDLRDVSAGEIICEELFPVTTVRIGDKSTTLQDVQKDCRIHVYAGKIITK